MLEKIQRILEIDCQLSPDRQILVGVSGGPDSLCLFDLLNRLGYPLLVAHLNHALRPEAAADALRVREIAETRNVPFLLAEADVASFAESASLSIEEAARLVRYRFLFEQAHQYRAQAVAVGHTADDQVETVLMHLLRGAGLAGLGGMAFRMLPNPWHEQIPLVRPLLATWREEILDYCAERGLNPLHDRTNLDVTFFRNRLRHELLPVMESYNPAVRRILWRMAQTLRDDNAVMDEVVARAWETCLRQEGVGFLLFDLESLNRQPLGIRRNLLRKAIITLRSALRDIPFESVERALMYLAMPSPAGKCDLLAGLYLHSEQHNLWLATWEADLPTGDWPQLPADGVFLLDVPGEVELSDSWRLSAEPVLDLDAARALVQENTDPFRAWLDVGSLTMPLHVRNRRPGEHFQPLGMGGRSLRLSEFMINVKLPRRARQRWPLVCSENTLLWLPGFRLAHPFRLTASTRQAVFLRLELDRIRGER